MTAVIDGANRRQNVVYNNTMPDPVILSMLILKVGSILNAGFEQIFVMQNSLVYEVSEVLDTFVYKTGFQQANYGLSTAVGLFKSVVGLAMVLISNNITKKFGRGNIMITMEKGYKQTYKSIYSDKLLYIAACRIYGFLSILVYINVFSQHLRQSN